MVTSIFRLTRFRPATKYIIWIIEAGIVLASHDSIKAYRLLKRIYASFYAQSATDK